MHFASVFCVWRMCLHLVFVKYFIRCKLTPNKLLCVYNPIVKIWLHFLLCSNVAAICPFLIVSSLLLCPISNLTSSFVKAELQSRYKRRNWSDVLAIVTKKMKLICPLILLLSTEQQQFCPPLTIMCNIDYLYFLFSRCSLPEGAAEEGDLSTHLPEFHLWFSLQQ